MKQVVDFLLEVASMKIQMASALLCRKAEEQEKNSWQQCHEFFL